MLSNNFLVLLNQTQKQETYVTHCQQTSVKEQHHAQECEQEAKGRKAQANFCSTAAKVTGRREGTLLDVRLVLQSKLQCSHFLHPQTYFADRLAMPQQTWHLMPEASGRLLCCPVHGPVCLSADATQSKFVQCPLSEQANSTVPATSTGTDDYERCRVC